jgi:4-hydroxythreonine-4-phosphate dehydrogenase
MLLAARSIVKTKNPNSSVPTIGLAIGDPAGIGPELAAKLLKDPDVTNAANLIVIGDERILRWGAEQAGLKLDLAVVTRVEEIQPDRTMLLDLGHLDPSAIKVGTASKAGGAFALENFRVGLQLAQKGTVNAVCFTPFNKAAMRMAHPFYDDEIGFITSVLDIRTQASELNILEGLWNARVTSHIPISAVAEQIKSNQVLASIRFTDESLRMADFEKPRIAVAGLNPHAGDGGNFGHEDEDEIKPAVEAARRLGIHADGPFPPDTVFLHATKGNYDAVVTMYHDQGQIAMKLIGFDRGVTLLAGYPFPVCTPAHGSAYDISGKGIANIGASRAAVLLAAKMVLRNRLHSRLAHPPRPSMETG